MEFPRLIQGDCLDHLRKLKPNSVDSLVTDPPAGISFMGKDWDGDKGGRSEWISWMTEVMRECLRVLKPGAHGLVWALPRTSHWTATALEDAGFEVRDVITHLFGQGFPKSLDISKAIDKAAGAERAVVRKGFTSSEEQGGTYAKGLNAGFQERQLTAPATDAAKEWQGWGTALKPASEHWILVRKPCSEKTVAKNVLKWGTGGLNIDGSRIHPGDEVIARPPLSTNKNVGWQRPWNEDAEARRRAAEQKRVASDKAQSLGRFPANLILSHSDTCEPDQCSLECAVYALDLQSGTLSKGHWPKTGSTGNKVYGKREPIQHEERYTESGGASRFFYCAKIAPSERGEGNTHPTVKPQKLMRYLIRMITPPNGTVLDPFTGSGSTGVAALGLGFKFIGIEREPEYVAIAEKRMEACV